MTLPQPQADSDDQNKPMSLSKKAERLEPDAPHLLPGEDEHGEVIFAINTLQDAGIPPIHDHAIIELAFSKSAMSHEANLFGALSISSEDGKAEEKKDETNIEESADDDKALLSLLETAGATTAGLSEEEKDEILKCIVERTRLLADESSRKQGIAPLRCAATCLVLDLIVFPGHLGIYYLLAWLCFLVNSFDEAAIFVELGKLSEGDHQELDELAQEIEETRLKFARDAGHQPLIINNDLSPGFEQALTEVFKDHDADADGKLSRAELQRLMSRCMDDAMPPPSAVRSICLNFSPELAGECLSLDGFLEFYFQQTMSDPLETMKDLKAFRYSLYTLKKLDSKEWFTMIGCSN